MELISCSAEHQENKVGSVGRKGKNIMSLPVITFCSVILITVIAQTLALVQTVNSSLVSQVL